MRLKLTPRIDHLFLLRAGVAASITLIAPTMSTGVGPTDRLTDSRDACAVSAGRSIRTHKRAEGFVYLSPEELLKHARNTSPVLPPAMLHNSNLHGTMVVEVYVNTDGKVVGVRPIRGHPLAVRQGLQSARSWVFKPYYSGDGIHCMAGRLFLSYDFRRAGPPN
jgi:outer membrane biosynthesis protein TonB